MSRQTFTPLDTGLIFVGVMVGLAVIGGGVGWAVVRGYVHFAKPTPVTQVQAAVQTPPEPRLQVDPLADRRVALPPETLAASGGPGGMPVSQAMQALARQGWPGPEPRP